METDTQLPDPWIPLEPTPLSPPASPLSIRAVPVVFFLMLLSVRSPHPALKFAGALRRVVNSSQQLPHAVHDRPTTTVSTLFESYSSRWSLTSEATSNLLQDNFTEVNETINPKTDHNISIIYNQISTQSVGIHGNKNNVFTNDSTPRATVPSITTETSKYEMMINDSFGKETKKGVQDKPETRTEGGGLPPQGNNYPGSEIQSTQNDPTMGISETTNVIHVSTAPFPFSINGIQTLPEHSSQDPITAEITAPSVASTQSSTRGRAGRAFEEPVVRESIIDSPSRRDPPKRCETGFRWLRGLCRRLFGSRARTNRNTT